MRADGIIRRFDDLGRIVIPKEIRRQLFGKPEKSEGMPMEVFMDKDDIVLRKYIEHISDDVCEWEYNKHFEFAKSKCGSIDTHRIEFKKLKYCPYCSKKIKVVE